jgi:hypothetical protein
MFYTMGARPGWDKPSKSHRVRVIPLSLVLVTAYAEIQTIQSETHRQVWNKTCDWDSFSLVLKSVIKTSNLAEYTYSNW